MSHSPTQGSSNVVTPDLVLRVSKIKMQDPVQTNSVRILLSRQYSPRLHLSSRSRKQLRDQYLEQSTSASYAGLNDQQWPLQAPIRLPTIHCLDSQGHRSCRLIQSRKRKTFAALVSTIALHSTAFARDRRKTDIIWYTILGLTSLPSAEPLQLIIVQHFTGNNSFEEWRLP